MVLLSGQAEATDAEWLGDLRHQGARPAGGFGPRKAPHPSQHENGDLTAPPWHNGAFSSSMATALLLSLPPRVKQTATGPNNARSPFGPLMSYPVTSQVLPPLWAGQV